MKWLLFDMGVFPFFSWFKYMVKLRLDFCWNLKSIFVIRSCIHVCPQIALAFNDEGDLVKLDRFLQTGFTGVVAHAEPLNSIRQTFVSVVSRVSIFFFRRVIVNVFLDFAGENDLIWMIFVLSIGMLSFFSPSLGYLRILSNCREQIFLALSVLKFSRIIICNRLLRWVYV